MMKAAKILGLMGAVCLTACSQTKRTPHPTEKMEHLTPPGSLSAYEECSRGIIAMELMKNYVKKNGRPVLYGKGIVFEKPVSKGAKDVKPMNLGGEMEIYFGSQPAPAEAPTAETFSSKAFVSTYGLLTAKGSTDGEPIAAILKKQTDGSYLCEKCEDQPVPTSSAETGAGIMGIQSLVAANRAMIKLTKAPLAMTLPADLEGEKPLDSIKEIKLGADAEIEIPNGSAGLETEFITVVIQPTELDKNGRPAWDYTFKTKGNASTIKIPTQWKDGEGNEHGLKEGSVGIAIKRSSLAIKSIGGEGKLCVEASSGVVTTADVKK